MMTEFSTIDELSSWHHHNMAIGTIRVADLLSCVADGDCC